MYFELDGRFESEATAHLVGVLRIEGGTNFDRFQPALLSCFVIARHPQSLMFLGSDS